MRFAPVSTWRTGRALSLLGNLDLSKGEYLDVDFLFQGPFPRTIRPSWMPPTRQKDDWFKSSSVHTQVPRYRGFFFEMDGHFDRLPSLYSLSRYGQPGQLYLSLRTRLTDEEYWSNPRNRQQDYEGWEPSDLTVLMENNREQREWFYRRLVRMDWDKHYDNLGLISELPLSSPRNQDVKLMKRLGLWDVRPMQPFHLDFTRNMVVVDRLKMTILFNLYVDRDTDPNAPKRRKPKWYRDEEEEARQDRIEELMREVTGQNEKETEEEKETRLELKRRDRENDFFEVYVTMLAQYVSLTRPVLAQGKFKRPDLAIPYDDLDTRKKPKIPKEKLKNRYSHKARCS